MPPDDDIRKLIGARIRELRLIAGLSQEQLAEELGRQLGTDTSPVTISRYERGLAFSALDTLAGLAAALGTDLRSLFAVLPGEPVSLPSPEVQRMIDLVLPLTDDEAKRVRKLVGVHLAGVTAARGEATD